MKSIVPPTKTMNFCVIERKQRSIRDCLLPNIAANQSRGIHRP